MTARDRDELFRLVSAVCDGQAAPTDHRRLEGLLRTDTECRRLYLQYLDLHATLLQHPDPNGSSAAPARPSPARRGRGPRIGFAAALAVAAGIAVAVWVAEQTPPDFRPTDPARMPEPQGGYVATLGSAGGCRWESTPTPRQGDRLPAGEYALAAGVAEVRLDGGAALTLEGPARFRIRGRREVHIESGRILFQADGTAESVHVTTSRSAYLNLGTKYVMSVGRDGDDLHVLDGEVRRSIPGGPAIRAEITPAGAARRFASISEFGAEIPLDRSVPHPTPAGPVGDGGLIASDGFDYAGADAAGPDRAGGVGWTSAWIPHRDLPPIGLDPADLPWPGVGPAAGGASVRHTGGRTAMHRYLETPIRLDRDGTYYVSYCCRRAAATDPDDANQLMVVLRKWGMSVEQEILQRTSLRFTLARPGAIAAVNFDGATTRTPLPLAADTTYLVVGKILAGRDRPDQVFLRVYRPEDPPKAEPAEWQAVSPALHSNAIFDQVSVEFTSRSDIWLDDLRIGRTWSAVTRPAAIEEK